MIQEFSLRWQASEKPRPSIFQVGIKSEAVVGRDRGSDRRYGKFCIISSNSSRLVAELVQTHLSPSSLTCSVPISTMLSGLVHCCLAPQPYTERPSRSEANRRPDMPDKASPCSRTLRLCDAVRDCLLCSIRCNSGDYSTLTHASCSTVPRSLHDQCVRPC
jgi:hypothetical protein